jgi:HEAT repeat protein
MSEEASLCRGRCVAVILVSLAASGISCGTAPKSPTADQDTVTPRPEQGTSGTEQEMPGTSGVAAGAPIQTQLPAVEDEGSYEGKPTSAWVRQLEQGREESLLPALEAIAELGPQAKAAVPTLVKLLKHESSVVVGHALVALEEIGPAAEPSLPAVIEALEFPDPDVGVRIYHVLKSFGPRALPPLLKALEVDGVSSFPIPPLLDRLSSSRREDRAKAEIALELMGPETITALAGLSQDPAKAAALRILVRMGPEAVPELVDIVNSGLGNSDLVAGALTRIGPEAAAALRDTFRNGQPMARVRALGILAVMEDDPIPTLLEALEDPDPRVPLMALDQLIHTAQPGDALVLRALAKATTHSTQQFRAAVYALFDKQAGFVVPVLIDALQDEEDRTRAGSARALSNFGQDALDALPALIEAAADESWRVRFVAAGSLVRIAPDDEKVRATLRQLLDDETPQVRDRVRRLLESIEKG